MRLTGPDPELVYVAEEREPDAPVAGAEEGHSARITLRLPESLKAAVELAASREGISVNAWIVRSLSRMSSAAPTTQSGNRLTGYARG